MQPHYLPGPPSLLKRFRVVVKKGRTPLVYLTSSQAVPDQGALPPCGLPSFERFCRLGFTVHGKSLRFKCKLPHYSGLTARCRQSSSAVERRHRWILFPSYIPKIRDFKTTMSHTTIRFNGSIQQINAIRIKY